MLRSIGMLVCVVLVLGSARTGEAHEPCDPDDGQVLFETIPDSFITRRPHLRSTYLRLRRQKPKQQVELVRLRRGAARFLLDAPRAKLQLRVFGECIPLPLLLYRKTAAGGIRVFGARRDASGSWAYVTVVRRDPGYNGPGKGDPFVYVSAFVSGNRVEIRPQTGGDPDFGRLYTVRRGRTQLQERRRKIVPARHAHDVEPMPPLTAAERRALRQSYTQFGSKLNSNEPLDIAVGYTEEVRLHPEIGGSETAILSICLAGGEYFQDALRASGFKKDVNIVGVVDTGIKEADYAGPYGNVEASDLLGVAYNNRTLRKYRRKRWADFASLLAIKIGLSEGHAYVWTPYTWWPLGARGAYSVVNLASAGDRGFAHECGHNVGCGHTPAGSLSQEPYSHAWCRTEEGVKYCTELASYEVNGGFEWLQRFSEDRPRFGGPNNDNVRLLRRNITQVAYWGYVIQVLPP